MARTRSVTLDDQLEKFVDEQVASGRFGSVSEVVSEGLRRFEADERQLAWLRKQISIADDQIQQGQVHEMNDAFWETLDREVDERLKQGDRPSPHVCP